MDLVREGGHWLISDFDGRKQACLDYISH